MGVDPGRAGDDGRMPVDDQVIAVEEAQHGAAQAEERPEPEPLGQPAVPGRRSGGQGSRHDRLDGVDRAVADHGEMRATRAPRYRGAQRLAHIGDGPDQGPATDGGDEDRHHEANPVLVDRQPEQIERQVLAEHRVGDPRRRRAEEADQRHPQPGGAGPDQGGDDQARDQRRAGRQAGDEAPGGKAPIDRDKRTAKDQHCREDRALQAEREPEPVGLAKLGEPAALQRDAHGRLKGDDRKAGERDIGQVPVDTVDERRRGRVATMPEHRRRQRNRRNQQKDQVAQPEHQVVLGTQARSPQETSRAISAWRA